MIERYTLTVTEKESPVYLIVFGSLNWFDEKKKEFTENCTQASFYMFSHISQLQPYSNFTSCYDGRGLICH